MLRILLLIVISYIVIRIALRLLFTESPAQRRARVKSQQQSPNAYTDHRNQGFDTHNARHRHEHTHKRFENIEDVEFEEIPPDPSRTKSTGK